TALARGGRSGVGSRGSADRSHGAGGGGRRGAPRGGEYRRALDGGEEAADPRESVTGYPAARRDYCFVTASSRCSGERIGGRRVWSVARRRAIDGGECPRPRFSGAAGGGVGARRRTCGEGWRPGGVPSHRDGAGPTWRGTPPHVATLPARTGRT